MGRRANPENIATVYCANEAGHDGPFPLQRFKSEVSRNTTGRFFCSAKCRGAVGSKPRRYADRACENCGKTYRPRNDRQRYCSRECADIDARTSQTERKCRYCGRLFERPAGDPDQFCDRSHYDAYRAEGAKSYATVRAPDHPRAWFNGRQSEHVVVMEKVLGRTLLDGENVHHRNGNKRDNRPENLELWTTSQPNGQRVEDRVEWMTEQMRIYAPERLTRSLRRPS